MIIFSKYKDSSDIDSLAKKHYEIYKKIKAFILREIIQHFMPIIENTIFILIVNSNRVSFGNSLI